MHSFAWTVLLPGWHWSWWARSLFSDYFFISYNNDINSGLKSNPNFVEDEIEFFYVVLDTNNYNNDLNDYLMEMILEYITEKWVLILITSNKLKTSSAIINIRITLICNVYRNFTKATPTLYYSSNSPKLGYPIKFVNIGSVCKLTYLRNMKSLFKSTTTYSVLIGIFVKLLRSLPPSLSEGFKKKIIERDGEAKLTRGCLRKVDLYVLKWFCCL